MNRAIGTVNLILMVLTVEFRKGSFLQMIFARSLDLRTTTTRRKFETKIYDWRGHSMTLIKR